MEEQNKQFEEYTEELKTTTNKKNELLQELQLLNEEIAKQEATFQDNIKSMESQIEEQKAKKEEYDKKTNDLNAEFASLMKQEKELSERKAKKKQALQKPSEESSTQQQPSQ